MSARDRKALDFARARLAAALIVLAEMETHSPISERRYSRKLREALGVGDLKLKCECRDCSDQS